jgi:carboxyl-terminal processing protease
MRRNDAGVPPRRWPVHLLITGICLALFELTGYAAPRIDEIRTIVAQKALLPPSSAALSGLNSANLDAGLQAMDPYARYVPASSRSATRWPLHLGVEVFAYKSRVWVRPDTGGPAEKAGVPEIGELLAINGKGVPSTDLALIDTRLDRAVKKGQVNLTVAQGFGGKERLYHVKPRAFQPPSVTWRRLGRDLVLRITEFASHDTAPAISARLSALKRPGNRVVLDLRGCPGGDLYEALEVAGLFVSAGRPLVSTHDRSGKVQTFRSPPGKKQRGRVLLLMDRRTASSAEILAGILQQHHAARVVGERSYGKCVSQALFPLSDRGGLWLTTLAISFPDNTSCNGNGIAPDVTYPDISVTATAAILNEMWKGDALSH